MDEQNIQELLSQGIAAAKAGKRDDARKLFFDVVALDPQCFEVWLWLGGIADDPTESVAYLSHALEMNPGSIRAQKGMAWAQERLAASESAPPEAAGLLERAAMQPAQPVAAEVPPLPAERAVQLAPEAPAVAPVAVEEVAPPAAQAAEARQVAEVAQAPVAATEPAVLGEATAEQPVAAESPAGEPAALEETIDVSAWSKLLQPESLFPEETDALSSAAPAAGLLGLEQAPGEAAGTPTDLDWEGILARLKSFDEAATDQAAVPATPDAGEAPAAAVEGPVLEAPSPAADTGAFASFEPSLAPELESTLKFDLLTDSDEMAEEDAALPPIDLFASSPPSVPGATGEAAESWIDRLAAQQTAPLSEAQAGIAQLIAEGKHLMEAGNATEAIPKFTAALQVNPSSLEAREQLGVALYQVGRDEEAAKEFRAIIGIKPDHAEAHANLGFILAEQQKYEEAIDAFGAAIKYDPTLVEAHLGLAEIHQSQNRVQDAIAQWKAAAALRPDLVEVHKFLGDSYVSLGRWDDAVAEYRQMLERDPKSAYAHLRVGEAYVRMDHLGEAAEEFRQAISLDDSLAEAHYGLGVCLAEQGQRGAAIPRLERALALRPEYPEARASLDALIKQPAEAGQSGDGGKDAGVAGEDGKKRRGLFRWGRK